MVVVKRRCVNPFASDVFEEFGPVDDLGSFGDSWGNFHGDSCGSSECVPDVNDVSVSPSSVGVLGEVSPSDSDFAFVKSQSLSCSRKRQALHMETKGDVNAASSLEDVQPLSRRMAQEVDCGPNQRWAVVYQAGCKKDAELLGQQQ